MQVIEPIPDGARFGNTVAIGTIADLADTLHSEYAMQGFGVVCDDVLEIVLNAVLLYTAYENLVQNELTAGNITLGKTTVIYDCEWVVIEPVIRANINLLQARRSEAMRSQGFEPFGLSVGEAEQAYNDAKLNLPKNAFTGLPFSIEDE